MQTGRHDPSNPPLRLWVKWEGAFYPCASGDYATWQWNVRKRKKKIQEVEQREASRARMGQKCLTIFDRGVTVGGDPK